MDELPDCDRRAFRVVEAPGEVPRFLPGAWVRVDDRSPIGHYRVPTYLRDKIGCVEMVIEPAGIDNEEEGFGRNAGRRRHYYRLAFGMAHLWPHYVGKAQDTLRVEVFENWLRPVDKNFVEGRGHA